MSEPREFKAVHMLRDAHSSDPQCFTQYTFNPRLHLIEHSAYLTEKEAKERAMALLKELHSGLLVQFASSGFLGADIIKEAAKKIEKQLEAGK